MPEPFLSHMNVDENSPNVARVGRWEPNAYDLLQRIAGATNRSISRNWRAACRASGDTRSCSTACGATTGIWLIDKWSNCGAAR